jgi:hypothetical protein
VQATTSAAKARTTVRRTALVSQVRTPSGDHVRYEPMSCESTKVTDMRLARPVMSQPTA